MKRTDKQIIVKVQTLILGWNKKETITPILVYDKKQNIIKSFLAPRGLKNWMGGKSKRYFYAHIDKDKKLILTNLALEQKW